MRMSKQEKKGLVPVLRFPEFRNAGGWKVKSFDELFTIGNGRDYKHLSSGDVPVYGSGGYMLSVNDHLHDGESVCIGRKGTINNPMFLTGKFWTVDTLFYTHSFNDCLPRFIYSIFQNIDWLKHNEAGGVPSLSKTNIGKIKVAIPKLNEQQKIADCLTSVDELITTQTQKLDALKTHKKGLMQQLFPAEGETVPRLRFPEFRDKGEWEGKKLSKIAELTSSKRVHLSDYVPNGIPFFRGKEITLLKNREIPGGILYISEEHYEEIREKYGVPETGDILITSVGTLGNVYRIQNSDKFYFKDGNLIWMKNISEDSRFLEMLLHVKSNDVLGTAIGSSQKALTMVGLNKLEFMFPKKEEQQKIADCLSSIDELITAQAQKLDAVKAHKKGLMQQLFPSVGGVAGEAWRGG
jgi:type I restriction enzyme S subunit